MRIKIKVFWKKTFADCLIFYYSIQPLIRIINQSVTKLISDKVLSGTETLETLKRLSNKWEFIR